MAKKITYSDLQVPQEIESCEIDVFPKTYNEATINIKTLSTQSYNEISSEINMYNAKLSSLKQTREILSSAKYTKDNLLCKVIELTVPPKYLKHEMYNYKALVLYFMREFQKNTKLYIKNFDVNKEPSSSNTTLYKSLFQRKNFFTINTKLDTLLHLINIDKDAVRTENILEQMLYDTIEYGAYSQSKHIFKAKVASIVWLKNTIINPDFIYDKDAIIAKHLKFDFAFVRQTGTGKGKEKYMYHLVGIKRIKENYYTVVSQFPIEKDQQASKKGSIISGLHSIILCDQPIYIKSHTTIPLFDGHTLIEGGNQINRLHKHFGK